ncbi:Cell division cycle-associated protein 3 [Heterocephalus glaber]|uniref:Cell division cycle-associated protein 3 n=1 Tax=Heterocephalus glaber TaxID=10181 RepID=G5CAR3_HETGA|nr:cell division cycle-associated protein 3 [Heterocephalus glaber]XP_004869512.1 cell division cycle-associated protein 3 [Heterocephalus glaber]EHB18624.1 Cell division cycle-associated protein 3 [Heterocephalus glaber]
MGSAKSVPATPARPPPRNKHLARVADPRSPSAGIQRTPIQVESSPQTSLSAREELEDPEKAQDSDPRSPTLGITRTPMKASSADPESPLVKQLSEVFETEASKSNLPPDPLLPLGAVSSSELDFTVDTHLFLEDKTKLPSKQVLSKEEATQLTATPVASQTSDKPSGDPETPRSPGSKHNRRKQNSKVLGRSPLTILQDDNSPGTLTARQGKRPSPLSENVGEVKEGAILRTGRLLKTGGCSWEPAQDHDKENQHFPLVES